MNHRALQRTLFRMQLDPAYARALLDGEDGAVATSDLGEAERAALAMAGHARITADLGDTRRKQVLANILGEFLLSAFDAPASWADAFLRSDEFHDAIRRDRRLPLAFAAWASRTGGPHAGVLRLECEMAELRRAPQDAPGVPAGSLQLSPRARVVDLPSGTLDHAAALRSALDHGESAPTAPGGEGSEAVLLLAAPRPPHAWPQVNVEPLNALVAGLLRAADEPLDAAACAAYAAEHGADAEALESFAEGLIEDGVFLGG